MDGYQMFFPGSSSTSSSTAAAFPSQLQALVYSKSGTTANLGGERSTRAFGHGLLGSTLQLTGTENHVTTSNGRHLVGNYSSEAGAANHSEAASAGNKMMDKINSKKKPKKPKYAFQTRSQVDILDDGYRWRKYGQKAVKANKFPRSYYRCTYEGCNVKKQVQRLSKDEGIVVTTYEGMHTHPIDKPNSDNFEHILTQMQLTNYTTTPSQPS